MENKSSSILKKILIVIISVCVVLGSFGLGFLVRSLSYEKETATLNYILSMYRKYYYEDMESSEIIEGFENVLLDQYSDYYTAEEYAVIKKSSQGSHVGIGVTYSGNQLIVVNWNSPADRAGLKAGMTILAVKPTDSETFVEINETTTLKQALDAYGENQNFVLKVKEGENVFETTLAKQEYTETFVRYYDSLGEYGFRSVDGVMEFGKLGDNNAYNLEGKTDVAVIDYNGFSGLRSGVWGSAGQFTKALEQFKTDGKTNLIIDLRNNGGGYMDIMTNVASHLVGVENGKSVVGSIAKYKNGSQEIFKTSAVNYNDYGFKSITFLANANSASASEALMGAVLDYDAENIVKVVLEPYSENGVNYYRSYGKGIMQTTFDNVLTGEAIKLTTARIYWPTSNVTIHGVGITTALNDTLYKECGQKIYNATENGCVSDAVSMAK